MDCSFNCTLFIIFIHRLDNNIKCHWLLCVLWQDIIGDPIFKSVMKNVTDTLALAVLPFETHQ